MSPRKKTTFGKGVCHCGRTFEKKTPWHENCSTPCKTIAWILKKAKQLVDQKSGEIK